MKPHFLISLSSFLFIIHSFAQTDCANGLVIESPVIPKPTEAGIVSSTCSQIAVKWKGGANQTYLLTGTARNVSTNTVTVLAPPSAIVCDNAFNCTATLPVSGNTYVTWSVQAIGTADDRTFYSYPQSGAQDYYIATCPTPAAPRDNIVVIERVGNDRMAVRMYPNPVRTTLNIDVARTGISRTSSKDVIRVFDVNGRAVMIRQATEGNTQVNVRQLTPGTYFIRIENSKGVVLYNAKFIKE